MGLQNLTIKGKLTLLSGVFFAGMLIYAFTAFSTLSEIKIGGDLYTGITTADEVNNDYVPAGGHLLGAMALCFEMETDEKDPEYGLFNSHVEEFENARKRFETIHDQTARGLSPDSPLKSLLESAYTPGHEFLEIAHDKYIPLLQNHKYPEADEILDKQLLPLFYTHDSANKKFSDISEQILNTVETNATATVFNRTIAMVVVPLVAVCVVLALCFLIARGIIKPLNATVEVLNDVSNGNLSRRLTVTGKDEIAQMNLALNHTVENLSRVITDIHADSRVLSETSAKLSATSNALKANSQQTTAQAGAVSAAAEEVNQNVQTVSTATEEMSSSIKEISKNASEAAEVASSAAKLASDTTTTMTKLSESSAEIGNVIKVITSIAEQTNLLALNATIEAARAGEAGKGFAVVANEVKELAKETAKATEDIGSKVEAIQHDAKGAVAAIDEITAVIGRINDIQTTIASAVEEQTGVTNEIARNIAETAKGTSDIASNITGVASAATETEQTAGASQQAGDELSKLAVKLNQVVGRFTLSSNGNHKMGHHAS